MTPPGADEGARRDPIDEEALADLIHRYQARLLARIRLMMGPAARKVLESGDVLHNVFEEALRDTRERYRRRLVEAGDGGLRLANTDFDTGQPAAHGEYSLADETWAELLHRLAERKFAGVPADMRRSLVAFYAKPAETVSRKERKRLDRVRKDLAALR